MAENFLIQHTAGIKDGSSYSTLNPDFARSAFCAWRDIYHFFLEPSAVGNARQTC